MKRHITVISLACGILLLAACADDPQPPTATINYQVCVGLEGNCSTSCCASMDDRQAEGLTDVECEVRSDVNDLYKIDFDLRGRTSTGINYGISGNDVQFYSTATDRRPVAGCDEFLVNENDNEYPADSCDTLDVRTVAPAGGGCEVQMFLGANDVIEGQFQCKELKLPGGTLYLSTVYSGNVGWGEFTIANCDFRL